jgi:predicted DsbA family dithiol-disulfide isomerase
MVLSGALIVLNVCLYSQTTQIIEKMNNNTLLCNPDSGSCELPHVKNHTQESEYMQSSSKKPEILYFTDPICSACWGYEPQLRKLKLEYGNSINIRYVMGGLLPDWSYNTGGISKPADVAHHWDEVSRYYKMPIDGNIWLEDPLHSSYPPSIAYHAAKMQDSEKAYKFLRLIREMVFLKKLNICKEENLLMAAIESGLDTSKFREDFNGAAIIKFKEDLRLTGEWKVRGFPTMILTDRENRNEIIYGYRDYSYLENKLNEFYGVKPEVYEKGLKILLERYGSLTLREAVELSGESEEKVREDMRVIEGVRGERIRGQEFWVKY